MCSLATKNIFTRYTNNCCCRTVSPHVSVMIVEHDISPTNCIEPPEAFPVVTRAPLTIPSHQMRPPRDSESVCLLVAKQCRYTLLLAIAVVTTLLGGTAGYFPMYYCLPPLYTTVRIKARDTHRDGCQCSYRQLLLLADVMRGRHFCRCNTTTPSSLPTYLSCKYSHPTPYIPLRLIISEFMSLVRFLETPPPSSPEDIFSCS